MMTKMKAREMLKHGEVKGHPLTKRQRGLMGMVASGKQPKLSDHAKKLRRKRG